MTTTPIKLLLENFEAAYKQHRKLGKAKDLTMLLIQKIVEVAPDAQLEAEFDLIPATPAHVETEDEILRREILELRLENDRAKKNRISKYGTDAEREQLKQNNPDGLTVREISDLYSISTATVSNNAQRLEPLGYRYTGEPGKMPLVYSRASITSLAQEMEWVERTDQVQVQLLTQQLDAQAQTKEE